MINVLIKTKKEKIVLIEVKGHANYAKKGKDIVCAGVSLVSIGGANALEDEIKNNDVSCQIDENLVKIKTSNLSSRVLQNKLSVIKTQLETIEFKYKKNIKIIKEEI